MKKDELRIVKRRIPAADIKVVYNKCVGGREMKDEVVKTNGDLYVRSSHKNDEDVIKFRKVDFVEIPLFIYNKGEGPLSLEVHYKERGNIVEDIENIMLDEEPDDLINYEMSKTPKFDEGLQYYIDRIKILSQGDEMEIQEYRIYIS